MATYPELKDQVAVISGAGGNLGTVVVQRLYNEGCKLILIDRDAAGLRERLKKLGLNELGIVFGEVDLTRKPDVDRFIDEVAANHPLNILVNIAGGFKAGGPVYELDAAILDDLYNLNVKTMFNLSAAVARHMVAGQRGGRIISIAAKGGLTGVPGIAAYSATKSAVIRLTESMAAELLQQNITVNAVLPSVIDTPIARKSDPNADHTRWVTPESLADVIAFIASNASRDISGASIPVYGKS